MPNGESSWWGVVLLGDPGGDSSAWELFSGEIS